jgi:hypothetical protein
MDAGIIIPLGITSSLLQIHRRNGFPPRIIRRSGTPIEFGEKSPTIPGSGPPLWIFTVKV